MKMENKVQSFFRYSSKGHLMDTQFPSLESLDYYLDEFQKVFPDADASDIKKYRVDIYELLTDKND